MCDPDNSVWLLGSVYSVNSLLDDVMVFNVSYTDLNKLLV